MLLCRTGLGSYQTHVSLNKWRGLYILSHYDLTIDVKTDDKGIWCLKCVRHVASGQTGPTSLLHWGAASLSQAPLCYKMPHCVSSTFSRHPAEDSKVSGAVVCITNYYGNLFKSLCIMLLYEQETAYVSFFFVALIHRMNDAAFTM